MQIINIKNGIESGLTGAVIAIGNFDGVHKGHQQIIKQVLQTAKDNKKPAGILTFDPNPIECFTSERNYQLTKFDQKIKILASLGLDFTAYAEFDDVFSHISAMDFVTDILVRKLKVSYIFTGKDFKFGHRDKTKIEGNSELLKKLSAELGFKYSPVSDITNNNEERYSSTKARVLIANGKLAEAEKILGRAFVISGIVEHGKKVGAGILGYPTANISLDGYITPKFGVYKCIVEIDGKRLNAIANIGVKPTFGDNKPGLEVHILDFKEDLYIKNILVELTRFIREEKKFDSIEELKKQIAEDIKNVR